MSNALFLPLLFLLPVLAEMYKDDVLVLSDATFKEAIKTHEYLFLKIYMPGCRHCQELDPNWKEAARELKAKGSIVVMAEIDGSSNTRTAIAQAIRGYPTLDFFHNAEFTRYRGARISQALIAYVLNQTQEVLP